MYRRTAVLLAALVLLVTAGCGARNVRPNDELLETETGGSEYYVSGGDVLSVKVWNEPRLTGEVYVREDGRFSMPLIGEVDAAGKLITQVQDEVTKKLEEFIPGANVSISVLQASPVRYFMIGQFQKPGEYRSDKSITLLQAIAKAGGLIPFADTTVILIRQSEEGEMRYELDYQDVIAGKDPNPQLKDGDVVSVQ